MGPESLAVLLDDGSNMNCSNRACVGVVIVNWNGWRHTIAACRSLENSTYPSINIIIVDNASVDESLTRLRAAVPQAHIIANGVNAGFAGACNLGIRRAMDLGCDYVFLLNNDALVDENTIGRLVSASAVKRNGALLGSTVAHLPSGAYQFFGSRMGSVIREPEFMTVEKDAALLSQDFIETDYILGAAFFIPAPLLERIGSFDERFFLNYEETDLCYRARALGIACFIVPGAIVHHHANASIGRYPAPMQAYFMARNGLLFAEKHGPQQQRHPLFLLKRLYWDIRRARKAARRKALPTRAILRAFWDYARRCFGDCPAGIRRMDARYRSMSAPNRAAISGAGVRHAWVEKFRSLFQTDNVSRPEMIDLFGTSVAIGLGTLIFGGVFLSACIAFIAGVFHEPEFAHMRNIGFVMAGGLGIAFASWFLADAVRRPHWYD